MINAMLEKDILPLFDLTNNKLARESLLNLLSEPLISQQSIIERQNLLLELKTLTPIFKGYNYPPYPFYECCNFLEQTKYKTSFSEKSLFQFKLWKRSNREIYNPLYSGISNIIVFFFPLYDKYYARISGEQYPSFKKTIHIIKNFLERFDLAENNYAIRSGTFTDKKILRILQVVDTIKTEKTFAHFLDNFILFETYISIACAIEKNKFTFPEFSENIFSVDEVYHPAVRNCVSNSLSTNKNVILITGSNMSGKSTFLRSVWLCVYLAHVGLAVPALGFTLQFFDKIFISIDHPDDIDNGLSHFMTEIKALKMVVEAAATGRCFAVFDELFKGTNMEDALWVSNKTINGLKKFSNSYFFISTHLHALDEDIDRNTVDDFFLESIVVENTPKFTYQLKRGWSNVKIGKILFEQEGLIKLLE
ncbi:hypothetical protein ACFSPU_09110 [Haoranjiania flava]